MIDARWTIRLAALVALTFVRPLAAQQPAATPPPQPEYRETVDVVGATVLPGMEVPQDQIPAPVQNATADDIDRANALDLSDFLKRRATAVHINEIQGNPFQADVNYRGYTASPLLGTPQGLSVYLDGMRMNQPFGEVVSWDLIPRLAISSSTLMPGSNPLFGLNTLGGALVLHTKDGLTHKGTSVQGLFGSHLRRSVEFEHGGARTDGTLNWYAAGTLFGDDGWREYSPSAVRQVFAKIGWTHGPSALTVSGGHANNNLHGNGLQEMRLLSRDYASVYTTPDITQNRSTWITASARHVASERTAYAASAYLRSIHSDTLNGDINEASLDQSVYQPTAAERAALIAAGYRDVPASGASAANTHFPFWRCLANVLLVDEPAEKCNGLLNTTATRQRSVGVSAQGTWRFRRGALGHLLTAGAGVDASGLTFEQSSELGYLAPNRSVVGTGAFADGVSGGVVDGEPFDTRVNLDGTQRTWSLFAADTLALGSRWHATLSGRYNHTSIRNTDNIRPDDDASLSGEHGFGRLNPAVGMTFAATPALTAYAAYSEGSRTPTSVELGCANPDLPCKLPNAMAGDPPLSQVVTRTLETGVRGRAGRRLRWNAGVFRASNTDDILFVASETTGFGYFRNFGRTERRGLEGAVSGQFGRASLGTRYTWLSATFRSAETVNGTGNSSNEAASQGVPGVEGTIAIEPGTHIPLIPRHTLKVFGDVRLTRALSVDVDLLAISGAPARGNENGEHEPDGVYYLGPGRTDAYAVVNAHARYALAPRLQLFAQATNLFDRTYATAAQLGPTGLDVTGAFVARPFPPINGEYPLQQSTFLAPGAPRSVYAGVRVRF